MLLVKKCLFVLYLVLVKTRLETRLNNVLDRKETFFEYKNKIFQSPKYGIFPKGLTHAFGQKMPNFSLFRFGQIPVFSQFFAFKTGLKKMFNNVLERKESCFCVKKLQTGQPMLFVRKCHCLG